MAKSSEDKKNSKQTEIKKVSKESISVDGKLLDGLQELVPEAFAEGKIDWEKLRMTLGEEVDERLERYNFTWAGKRDAIKLLQVPSRATLVPVKDESVNWGTTKNIFIEGENLEVLKLLLKSYFGRVKMIYIDPPYNTGHDFVYKDNYADPLSTYLEMTGQKDSEGNIQTSNLETSGRYHSDWLSMMYPRIFLARQLLRDDGVLFVSIDDHEIHNLRIMVNEIFGDENIVEQIIWKKKYGGGAKTKYFVGLHEYILCYSRNKDTIDNINIPYNEELKKYYKYKDDKFDVRGPYRLQPLATTSNEDRPNLQYPITYKGVDINPEKQWQWSKSRVDKAIENDEMVFTPKGETYGVNFKQYLYDEEGNERQGKPFSIIEGIYTQHGTNEIKDLLGDGKVFTFPKPSTLISKLAEIFTEENDLVLDFFAGSCPAAHGVMSLNRSDGHSRQFIMVQLPEPTPEDSIAREHGFETISDIGKERIRRVLIKLEEENNGKLELSTRKTPEDLGFKVFKLTTSSYKPWTGTNDKDADKYIDQMEAFADRLGEGWKPENVIYEVALKEGYGLNITIEEVGDIKTNKILRVCDPEKDQSFLICLDKKLKDETPKKLKLTKDDLFICRDNALTDEQAANLALQCKLKTI